MTSDPAAAVDPAAIRRDVDGATAAHRRLLDTVSGLGDDDLRRPSALPDWTVGHVLAHLARNADSHVRLLDAGTRGEVAEQYEGGAAGRAAEIERDAALAADVLVADLRETADALERRWATMPTEAWAGMGNSVAGAVVLADLPFRRWRETELHHTDLGLGHSPDHWPALYVRLELVRMERQWAARRPMGLTLLPPEALAAPPAQRLAWLVGRGEIDGLAPAGIF
ncbi:MAG: maleylpyruvate isomerase N-terminal domain-containing protein [Actinobacteria bacterium]|nr:maleylpyruvate isomerase N-terminal domain-containing protein [Actinomycetota bacterium]